MSRRVPTIKTFTDAEEWLAGGRTPNHRKLQNNTQLIRLHPDRIAVRLHDTNVVILHRDNTFTIHTGGWDTVTTKDRLRSYSPARVRAEKGQLFVWHESDELTPPKLQKCRACKGVGHTWERCDGPGWCYDYFGGLTCQHEQTTRHKRDTCYHGKTDWHTWRADCYRCDGTGQRDYGSKPIPYRWDGDYLRVDDTGKVIGPEWVPDSELDLGSTPTPRRRPPANTWRHTPAPVETEQVYTAKTEPTQADIVARIQREIDDYERTYGATARAETGPNETQTSKAWGPDDETDPFAWRTL